MSEPDPAVEDANEPEAWPEDEAAIVEQAVAFLRRFTRGELRFDEHVRPIRYVIAPADGLLVAPVMVAMITAVDTVLYVPEAADGAMELQVTLEPFEEEGAEHGALADRWRIHHGDPPDVRWARMAIDMARIDGLVLDGAALMRPNPLAGVEASICRTVNAAHRDALVAAVRAEADVDPEDPRLVAVDPGGMDVRLAFGVTRLAFDAPVDDPEAAADAVRARLSAGAAG